MNEMSSSPDRSFETPREEEEDLLEKHSPRMEEADFSPASRPKRRNNLWLWATVILGVVCLAQTYAIWVQGAERSSRSYESGFETDLGEFTVPGKPSPRVFGRGSREHRITNPNDSPRDT